MSLSVTPSARRRSRRSVAPHRVEIDPKDGVAGVELVRGDDQGEPGLERFVGTADEVALAGVEDVADVGRLARLAALFDDVDALPTVARFDRGRSSMWTVRGL